MTDPNPARVLIADDQTLFRRGLAGLLSQDPRIEIVGEADDGRQAVAMVSKLNPDVVLMDIKMPGLDGIEATKVLGEQHPQVKVLILTTFDADGYVLQALRAGAAGYVLKDAETDAIVNSVMAVRSGERVVSGPVASRVLGMLAGPSGTKEYYDGLTAREVEVLKLVSSGLANKQIAYRLRLSEKTVRNHISNIYEKLQIFDRAHAVLYAVRKGLVEV